MLICINFNLHFNGKTDIRMLNKYFEYTSKFRFSQARMKAKSDKRENYDKRTNLENARGLLVIWRLLSQC